MLWSGGLLDFLRSFVRPKFIQGKTMTIPQEASHLRRHLRNSYSCSANWLVDLPRLGVRKTAGSCFHLQHHTQEARHPTPPPKTVPPCPTLPSPPCPTRSQPPKTTRCPSAACALTLGGGLRGRDLAGRCGVPVRQELEDLLGKKTEEPGSGIASSPAHCVIALGLSCFLFLGRVVEQLARLAGFMFLS